MAEHECGDAVKRENAGSRCWSYRHEPHRRGQMSDAEENSDDNVDGAKGARRPAVFSLSNAPKVLRDRFRLGSIPDWVPHHSLSSSQVLKR